jgi:hypothetical protein
MRSVFISHSFGDTADAHLLQRFFEVEGLQVWRPDSMLDSSEWRASTLSAIRRASVVVVFIDEPTPNVMLELGYALGAGKEVLLVGSHTTRAPSDVAALPIRRIDRLDSQTLQEVLEVVRQVAAPDASDIEIGSGRSLLLRMIEDPDVMEAVSPEAFEQAVCDFLNDLGLEAEQIPAGRDAGFDVRARRPGTEFDAAVEIKKYSHGTRLGVSHVRQLLGSMTLADLNYGMIISTSDFSKSARSLAEASPLPIALFGLRDVVSATADSFVEAVMRPWE